jgi:hypothetical protein
MKSEEPPTMVIKAPPNYEKTYELAECPLCHSPNPDLHIHIPVREFGYFDINIYFCQGDQKHIVSVKHKIASDADHLLVYNRTASWKRLHRTKGQEMKEAREELRLQDRID